MLSSNGGFVNVTLQGLSQRFFLFDSFVGLPPLEGFGASGVIPRPHAEVERILPQP